MYFFFLEEIRSLNICIKAVDSKARLCPHCDSNVGLELKKKKTSLLASFITKTYLYNFDPLKPHFYIVKLGLTGVYRGIHDEHVQRISLAGRSFSFRQLCPKSAIDSYALNQL